MQKYSLSILLSKKQLADASIQEALGVLAAVLIMFVLINFEGRGCATAVACRGSSAQRKEEVKGSGTGYWQRGPYYWHLGNVTCSPWSLMNTLGPRFFCFHLKRQLIVWLSAEN
ncbi:hypothetical protein CEXT_394741 [Caerostris extrusa]|uniref:Uncharacterized protein n=1 Tax=Caerostris extrusa TaxID=172846 RepID=A0AAV4Y7V3_CAEEX|nr:hypothetical protein CEXT_394741 [Caerostris extrusa]